MILIFFCAYKFCCNNFSNTEFTDIFCFKNLVKWHYFLFDLPTFHSPFAINRQKRIKDDERPFNLFNSKIINLSHD